MCVRIISLPYLTHSTSVFNIVASSSNFLRQTKSSKNEYKSYETLISKESLEKVTWKEREWEKCMKETGKRKRELCKLRRNKILQDVNKLSSRTKGLLDFQGCTMYGFLCHKTSHFIKRYYITDYMLILQKCRLPYCKWCKRKWYLIF